MEGILAFLIATMVPIGFLCLYIITPFQVVRIAKVADTEYSGGLPYLNIVRKKADGTSTNMLLLPISFYGSFLSTLCTVVLLFVVNSTTFLITLIIAIIFLIVWTVSMYLYLNSIILMMPVEQQAVPLKYKASVLSLLVYVSSRLDSIEDERIAKAKREAPKGKGAKSRLAVETIKPRSSSSKKL